MMSFFTKDEFVVRFDFFIWCFFSPCLYRKHIRDWDLPVTSLTDNPLSSSVFRIFRRTMVFIISLSIFPLTVSTPHCSRVKLFYCIYVAKIFLLYLCCKDFFIVSLLQRTNMKNIEVYYNATTTMIKKRIISIIVAIVAMGATAVTSVVIKRNNNTILNQNVEALMDSEGMYGAMCSKTGTSGTYRMKLCKNCTGLFGYYSMDVIAFCLN